MIAAYVRIDYYGQLRRIDPRQADTIYARLKQTAEEYGARPGCHEHPFLALFDYDSIFWRLQAVEAVLEIRKLLREQLDGTQDCVLALHAADDEEALEEDLSRTWASLDVPDGLWLTPQAARELGNYLSLRETPSGLFLAGEPTYRMDTLPMTSEDFYRREDAAASLSELIGELVVGGERSVLLVSGPSGTGKEATVYRALSDLGYPAEDFLTLRGGTANPRPFDPLACGVTDRMAEEARGNLFQVERSLYDRLLPAYRHVFASPYRTALSPSMETGYKLFMGLILRAYVRKMSGKGLPPIILCENLHRFSPESLDLLGEILVSSEARILATTSKGAPESWPAFALTEWTLHPPTFDEYAGKLLAMLPDASEDERRALFSRARGDLPLLYRCALMARDHQEGPPPSEAILGRMPREASATLYAASLCENVLDNSKLQDFLEQLGLKAKARRIVLEILKDTGYLSGAGSRNSSRMSNRRLAGFVGRDAERIEQALAEYLTVLYRNRQISPSLGLLNATRKWEGPDRRRFEIDCALSDALADPADHARTANRDSPPAMRKLQDLASSILLGEGDRAESKLEELEAPAARPELPKGMTELFRAEIALARRSFPDAARLAKDALLNARGQSVPKTEARAHRILGLCALARERPEEGVEYLGNAEEIAAVSYDDYERLVCQFYIAVAFFTSARLDKALRQIAQTQESAIRIFRRDWEAACIFLRARLFMELGRYEQALAEFLDIRAIARAYDFREADARAEIWSARALAYCGRQEEAQTVLARHGGDTEAAFFLAELELLRGNPGKASELLDGLSALAHGGFDPAERIFWDSGYRGIERKAFGAAADYPYDTDLVRAYTFFARGLDKRDPECASALYRMTREEKIAQDHPAFPLYLYFCFLLLERLPEPPLDKGTVLSRAFKYLRERSGCIEDAVCGSDFLERNIWNRRLVEAARRYKLL